MLRSNRKMTVKFSRTSRLLFAFVCATCFSLTHPAWAAPASTTTALTLGSSGETIVENGTIASGSVLTLTAKVTAGTSSVNVGSVSFCDAAVPLCSDIHLIGTAQITQAGTAVFKFIPGIGTHTYNAVFAGTPNGATAYAGSSSSTSTVTVTGTYPTVSTLTSTGIAGNYSLTATVAGAGSPALTGAVSFIDTTSANAVLATQSLGTAVSSLNFFDASTPTTGQDPDSDVIADFNGDGIPDVAIANYGDGTITVLLGKGDGTFAPAPQSPITVTFDARALVAGDFNHDGKMDLAMTNSYYNGAVTILLGNGDGSFTPAPGTPITVGNSFQMANSLATGDFNGDGIQDIAVGVSNDGYGGQSLGVLVVLLGNGDGTFKQLPSVNLAQNPSLTAGDFNRDGITDLAIVDYYYGNHVAIYLGKGDGTFQEAVNSPVAVGQEATGAVAADLNGDGILDLAVSNMISLSSNGTVTVLLGAGDGTFTSASASPTVGVNPYNIAYGDFNGDGKTDLATANNGDDTVSYLLGNGDGTFQPTIASAYLGQFTTYLATGDINGDGLTDVIAVTESTPQGSSSFDGIASVLLSQPTVTSTALVNGINPLGTGTHQIQASYPGNSTYSASTSNSVTLTAQQATPKITVTPSVSSITTAQTLSVTVSISGPTGAPTPIGSVILTSGSYTSASTPLTGGTATISISAGALAVGSDAITAAYSGDTNYTTTTASATVTVTAISPSFAITSTNVTITAPGDTTNNTSTITVAPAGGFTGTVTFTAALTSSPAGAVNPPTFSFGATSSVPVTSTTPATATLTILTSAASNASLHFPERFVPATRGAILACLLVFAFPIRRRKGMLALVFFFALLAGSLSGCSGGSTSAPSNSGTTPGHYTVAVTGTSGTLTTTSLVTLTVQ
jgi:trimeric autotransporter adhesin